MKTPPILVMIWIAVALILSALLYIRFWGNSISYHENRVDTVYVIQVELGSGK